MLIMLVYSIVLLGIIVNAGDAPQINGFQVKIDELRVNNNNNNNNNAADQGVGIQRPNLNTVEVNYLRLGFSTPAAPPASPSSNSQSGTIAQGIYHEAWTLCIDSLWNTCVGRCGQSLYGAPYVCACDPLCPAFGDCCLDYQLECTFKGPFLNATRQNAYFEHLGKMVCISLAQDYDYGVLLVTECADWWPKGDSKLFEHSNFVRSMCESPLAFTFKPVEAEFGLVFKNIECYICNNLQNRNQVQKQDPPPSVLQLPTTCHSEDDPGATYRDLCRINLGKERMHHSTYRVCAYQVNECPNPSSTTTAGPGHVTVASASMASASRDAKTLAGHSAPRSFEHSLESETWTVRSDPPEAVPSKSEQLLAPSHASEAVPARANLPGAELPRPEAISATSGAVPSTGPATSVAYETRLSNLSVALLHELTASERLRRLTATSDGEDVNAKMNDMCSAYSKPVFGTRLFGETQSYKNVHCAHCHTMPTADLFCPSWKVLPTSRNSDTSGPLIFFETGLSAENKYEIRDIPASFAILYHFGSDGSQNTMFSSQSQEWWDETLDNCDDDQIWDPFVEVCRQIYCSAEFTLVDFQCVQVYYNDSSGGSDYDDALPDNVTQAIQNVDLTEVLVILAIQLDCCVDDDSELILQEQFAVALAASLNISAARFTNFTLYNVSVPDNLTTDGCPKETVVSLVLLGPNPASPDPEPSIEKVMASLSYGVALNHLLLHLEAGITIRVMGLREKVVRYANATSNNTDDWCEDGRQLYYTSGQFTPITVGSGVDNATVYMYINTTGFTYLPGQFIASILFEGDQRSVLANVTGAVVVCDQSDHNNTCVRVMLTPTEYVPLPNGSIVYTGDENITGTFDPGSYEIMSNGDALVCVTLPPMPNGTDDSPPKNSAYLLDVEVQSWLTTVLLSLSSLAILVTILTYVFFAELRNLPGWNMLHLASCLLVYQIIYLSGMRPSVTSEPVACELVAISLHYFLMAFFFWMNVVAYDLFKTFGRKSLLAVVTRDTKLLPWYALYAYGLPLAIVGGCVAVDQLDLIPGTWVGYGQGQECWIGNPVALVVVFATPTLIIIVANFAFYAVTVWSIRKIRHKTKLTTGLRSGKSQLVIYTRISTVMGFTWIFGHLSGIRDIPYSVHDVFSYLFIVLNTFQGAFIFFAFVCNKKIVKLYRNCTVVVRLLDCIDSVRRCRDCKELKCVCQKPITRTISNETCQSVIMDEKTEKHPS